MYVEKFCVCVEYYLHLYTYLNTNWMKGRGRDEVACGGMLFVLWLISVCSNNTGAKHKLPDYLSIIYRTHVHSGRTLNSVRTYTLSRVPQVTNIFCRMSFFELFFFFSIVIFSLLKCLLIQIIIYFKVTIFQSILFKYIHI